MTSYEEKVFEYIERWRSAFAFDGSITAAKLSIATQEANDLAKHLRETGGSEALAFAREAVGGIPGLDRLVREICK